MVDWDFDSHDEEESGDENPHAIIERLKSHTKTPAHTVLKRPKCRPDGLPKPQDRTVLRPVRSVLRHVLDKLTKNQTYNPVPTVVPICVDKEAPKADSVTLLTQETRQTLEQQLMEHRQDSDPLETEQDLLELGHDNTPASPGKDFARKRCGQSGPRFDAEVHHALFRSVSNISEEALSKLDHGVRDVELNLKKKHKRLTDTKSVEAQTMAAIRSRLDRKRKHQQEASRVSTQDLILNM
jgi:hypothetical protein